MNMTFDLFFAEFIQSFGGEVGSDWYNFLTVFFSIFTFFVEELSLIVVLFSIFWIGKKKVGKILAINLFAAISLNGLLKVCVARPRPFLNPDYNHLNYAQIDNIFVNTTNLSSSFSFPSGHAHSGAAIFTSFGMLMKKKWISVTCIFIIVMIILSRVFLGVHYFSDTIVGGILGVLSAVMVTNLMTKYEKSQYAIFAAALLLLTISFIFESIKGYPSAIDTVKMIGVGVGAFSGIILEEKTLDFKTDGAWWKKTLRVILGLALLMGIKEGLKWLFGLMSTGYVLTVIFAVVRYGIIGIFATYLYPLLFTKIKL